ncbi:MAG: cytochrome b/b6 domain-containing protein, partial [Pseudomonadota bacterium]
MRWVNSDQSWGLVAQLFHWVIAVLIIWAFYIGWNMTDLEISPEMFATYNFHKSLGLTILALALLRLGWRLANGSPRLPDGMSGVERKLAHLTHWGLYGILL